MTGTVFNHGKRLIISLLILFGISSAALSFQKDLSGNFIQPKSHVVTLGTDRVTVDNVSGFNVNDTILLIQMQGVKIYTDPGIYGFLENKYGEPGMWEFLIIQSINVPTKEIVFMRDLLKTYDPKGSIQIIRVPFYNTATVTGTLTCDPWSPTNRTGGVIAMFIGRSLKLNADIDVSGKGFQGGKDTTGDGICRATNSVLYGKEYYDRSLPYAGFKGEGIANYSATGALLFPGFSRGFGPNFTGGGGGNGRYSGGGGGSNRNLGGEGGLEVQPACSSPQPGGAGGFKAEQNPALLNRIFMGGGGGSSTSLSGLSTSAGSGGGIVIIIADTLIGNGHKIISDGGNGGTAIANAGAGGGGAAGSIGLSVSSYGSDTLKFYLNGGKGGDNPDLGGEGGGGSGGLLWFSTPLTSKVKSFVSGGAPGLSGAPGAGSGLIGENRPNFKANLNGFLFNSIRSSVTGDITDSICSNVKPKKITGTIPVGGTLPYSIVWEKKIGKNGGWILLVNNKDSINHTPQAYENGGDTVYFRRTVTDSSPIPFIDKSKLVEIFVQPAITGNLVGKDTIICFGQNPTNLISLNAGPANGNGKYAYHWLQNITNTNWNTSPDAIGGPFTNPSFDPSALTATTYYQRKVTSGRCIDNSTSVTITVLPTITGNIITRSDSVICQGSLFVNLSASAPGGGDGLFKYQWQDSITSSIWLPAVITNTNPAYIPDTSTFAVVENRFLRRVVFSGADSVCKSRTQPIHLTRYHKIKNNLITSVADTTIGFDSIPHLMKANLLVPGDGGNNVYTYLWQNKVTLWGSAPPANSLQNYQAGKLTDTTYYRRVVDSDKCHDTSNIIVVKVHDKIINNRISLSLASIVSDDTICSGLIPVQIKEYPPVVSGGDGIFGYQWLDSTVVSAKFNVIAGAINPFYQPGALTQTTWFRRDVASPAVSPRSVSKSNKIKIFVHSSLVNNSIPADTAVCMNTTTNNLIGTVPTGGNPGDYKYLWKESKNGGTYSSAPVPNTNKDYQPPLLNAYTKYKRFVMSGSNNACIDSSAIIAIDTLSLPVGVITTVIDTACQNVAKSFQVVITRSIASPWTVKYRDRHDATDTQAPSVTGSPAVIAVTPNYSTFTADSVEFIYRLISIVDKRGCKNAALSGSRKVVVYKNPKAAAGADMLACGPDTLLKAVKSLTNTALKGNWLWSKTAGPGNVVFSALNNPVARVYVDSLSSWSDENIYTFQWRESNWTCRDSDLVDIKFYKRLGSVYAGIYADLYSNDWVDTLSATVPVTGIKLWTGPSGVTIVSPSNPKTAVKDLIGSANGTVYNFLWTVENGVCKEESPTTITSYELIIPQGISPGNGDNLNDSLEIFGLLTDPLVNEVSISILNGGGTQVFFSSNIDGNKWEAWKGQNSSGKDLPDGSYYYLLTIKSVRVPEAPPDKRSGYIILKRN
jgi:hypothetical protein